VFRLLKEAQIIENKIEYGDASGEEDWKLCLRYCIDWEYSEELKK